MGPKSCSWASLFPYLLMALIVDWRKGCQNNCRMTRCQRPLINLTKEQQEQAMAITDSTKIIYIFAVENLLSNNRTVNTTKTL